jgi:hypothetical protein
MQMLLFGEPPSYASVLSELRNLESEINSEGTLPARSLV